MGSRRGEAGFARLEAPPPSDDDAAAAPGQAQDSEQRISATDFSCIRVAPIDMQKWTCMA